MGVTVLTALVNPGPAPSLREFPHPQHYWPRAGRYLRRQAIRRFIQQHPHDPMIQGLRALLHAVKVAALFPTEDI
jgi:hypothetical protein